MEQNTAHTNSPTPQQEMPVDDDGRTAELVHRSRPMQQLDASTVARLVQVSQEAADALGELLNAEIAVGNDEVDEDVQHALAVSKKLDRVLAEIEDMRRA